MFCDVGSNENSNFTETRNTFCRTRSLFNATFFMTFIQFKSCCCVQNFIKIGRFFTSSSSRMRAMNHNWSATKQHLHPQSVAEISRHSVLSGGQDLTMWDIIWVSPQGHRSFPSAGTVVSLFRVKTVQQRPLLPREIKTRLPDCGVTH